MYRDMLNLYANINGVSMTHTQSTDRQTDTHTRMHVRAHTQFHQDTLGFMYRDWLATCRHVLTSGRNLVVTYDLA